MEGKRTESNNDEKEKYEEDQIDNLESGYSNTIKTSTKKSTSLLGEEQKELEKPESLTIKILIDY